MLSFQVYSFPLIWFDLDLILTDVYAAIRAGAQNLLYHNVYSLYKYTIPPVWFDLSLILNVTVFFSFPYSFLCYKVVFSSVQLLPFCLIQS